MTDETVSAERESSVSIVFSGPDVDAGNMDAKAFAESLLAFTDLCKQAYSVLTSKKTIISVRIESDIKKGSFEFILLIQELFNNPDLFSGLIEDGIKFIQQVDNAKRLLRLLFSRNGLLDFIRRETFNKNVPTEERKDLGIEGPEEEIQSIKKMERTPEIRQAISDFFKPLKRQNISEAAFKDPHDKEQFVKISNEEMPLFDMPRYEDTNGDIDTLWAYVLTPQLDAKDDKKWRFKVIDGKEFKASVIDEGFRIQVRDGKFKFGGGDSVKIKRQKIEKQVGGRIKLEYKIIEVLERKERVDLQEKLDF